MDVYVIPIGPEQYELYCEAAPSLEQEVDTAPPAPTSFIGRQRQKFLVMLRAAEERRQQGSSAPKAETWLGRLQEWILGWVAERIAEQRLLWSLRSETTVTLMHPAAMPFDRALTLVHRMLQRDFDRHRIWLVVDSVLLIASAILAILPGPNIVAYYFAFRVVGHWLSMRGATQGRRRVTWTGCACEPLDELHDLAALTPEARDARVHEVAARLRLPHLPTFVARVAVRHS
jgi:hypothetical protein